MEKEKLQKKLKLFIILFSQHSLKGPFKGFLKWKKYTHFSGWYVYFWCSGTQGNQDIVSFNQQCWSPQSCYRINFPMCHLVCGVSMNSCLNRCDWRHNSLLTAWLPVVITVQKAKYSMRSGCVMVMWGEHLGVRMVDVFGNGCPKWCNTFFFEIFLCCFPTDWLALSSETTHMFYH